MVVDGEDDPKPVPAGDAPAGEKTAETPTEPQPEGEQPEAEATEAEATADEELVGDVGEEPDEDSEEGESEEQKKSRAQRYREERTRLRAENESLRARASGDVPSDAQQLQRAFEYKVWQQIGDPPNQADPQYRDDYVGFSVARQAWETDRRQVTRQVREEFKQQIDREQERVSNLIADHKERENRFKSRVKDYSEVMAKATLPVAPHIERLLLESKKSERIGYVLAKDQSKLARLNRMSPEAAAREIGRLEGRLSLPTNPKTQTQARKPIAPLKGGGASPPSQTASMNAYLKKLYGDRL